MTADDPSLEFDESLLDLAENVQDLLNKFKHTLSKKGVYGFKGLINSLNGLDEQGNGKLDIDDLKWGLRNYGL